MRSTCEGAAGVRGSGRREREQRACAGAKGVRTRPTQGMRTRHAHVACAQGVRTRHAHASGAARASAAFGSCAVSAAQCRQQAAGAGARRLASRAHAYRALTDCAMTTHNHYPLTPHVLRSDYTLTTLWLRTECTDYALYALIHTIRTTHLLRTDYTDDALDTH